MSRTAKETTIPGVLLIEGRRFGDERGFFTEMYKETDFHSFLPADFQVKQINHSRSTQKGTLRGIHAEPWHKLIYILRGSVFVAIIDLRPENGGAVFTTTLNEGDQLFVPNGCGNSFQVLEDNTDYLYAVSGMWQPGLVYPAIAYNDPDLAIAWPIKEAIVSEKDLANPPLATFKKNS